MTRYRARATRIVWVGLAAGLMAGSAAWAQEESEKRLRLQVVELDEHPGHHAVFIGEGRGGGYLGVHLLPLTEELRVHFGVPAHAGVMVSKVVAGTPAAAAGLRVGDIVTTVDGETVSSPQELSRVVRHREVGELAGLEVWRDGSPTELEVAVAERERRVMDLRGAFEGLHGLEGDVTLHLDEAMGHLKRYFDGDEWQQRVRRFESLDWERIEARMREVEERLRSLESELEGQGQSSSEEL